jgi:hypothetical protein
MVPASPQLASLRHRTQAPAGEQRRPLVQSADVAQATHEWLVALQWVPPPPVQFVSERQPTQ